MSNSACVTRVQVIECFSPEWWLPDLLPTWEGEGPLETRCFPSLCSPCTKWGSASCFLVFQSPISLPLYHSLPEAHFSLQLINIPWIIWGGDVFQKSLLRCDIEPNLQFYCTVLHWHTIVGLCQRHSADSETKYDGPVLCVFLEYHKHQCFTI